MRMVYSETLMDHFHRPRHAGSLDASQMNVGTGFAGTKESGGVLRMQICVDDHGAIKQACFQAYGPPALIAAGSWLAENLHGRSLPEAESYGHKAVVEALLLPSSRLHFSFLAEDAVRAAIQDYKDKQKVYA